MMEPEELDGDAPVLVAANGLLPPLSSCIRNHHCLNRAGDEELGLEEF